MHRKSVVHVQSCRFAYKTYCLFDVLVADGDGSENVTFKMNSRFFKLFRVYSNSLKMSNEGQFFRK